MTINYNLVIVVMLFIVLMSIQFTLNKIYVLLNELLNSLDEKDSDVFYIKYKVFMEAVNNW